MCVLVCLIDFVSSSGGSTESECGSRLRMVCCGRFVVPVGVCLSHVVECSLRLNLCFRA